MTSGPDPDSCLVPLSEDFAGVLRHDLINPINLVVGYCELLLAEADEPWLATLHPLQSIRRAGFSLLQRIDRVLLDNPTGRSGDVLRDLGESMLEPALRLVEEADKLFESAQRAGLPLDVASDLDRIRSAGAQLVILAGSLESTASLDRHPQTDALRVHR